MYNHSFVILHYNSINDTIECVESIKCNLKDKDYSIIIVDNASTNDSGSELVEKYKDSSNIYVILNKDNLGFAKGNNLGFKMAKNEFNSNFIMLINNDTVINQNDFLDRIEEIYEESEFYVLGPDIITSDKIHQNPQKMNGYTKKGVIKQILRYSCLLILNYTSLEDKIRKLVRNIKGVQEKNYNYLNKHFNVQLHGSCLIFSRKYIDKYDGLYDKTFMYLEEDILFYLCKQNNMTTLYDPTIKILHKEDGATDSTFNKSKMKNRFIYLNSLKSAFKLLELMFKKGEEI